jgi:transposase-like protein
MAVPKCPTCKHRDEVMKVGGGRGWWWCDFCRHHFERKESPK